MLRGGCRVSGRQRRSFDRLGRVYRAKWGSYLLDIWLIHIRVSRVRGNGVTIPMRSVSGGQEGRHRPQTSCCTVFLLQPGFVLRPMHGAC